MYELKNIQVYVPKYNKSGTFDWVITSTRSHLSELFIANV